MEIKIEIKTPRGQAKATSKKLKPFILGFKKVKNTVWANKDDDRIFWVVDCKDSRSYMAIIRNLTIFDRLVTGILNNKLVHGVARLKPDEMAELNEMLHNQTKIRVVKMNEDYDMSDLTQDNKD
jgi:hypothetical protein